MNTGRHSDIGPGRRTESAAKNANLRGRTIVLALAVAAIATAFAVATRFFVLDPVLGPRPLAVLYAPAVLIASALGGLWGGLAATAMAIGAMAVVCRALGDPGDRTADHGESGDFDRVGNRRATEGPADEGHRADGHRGGAETGP